MGCKVPAQSLAGKLSKANAADSTNTQSLTYPFEFRTQVEQNYHFLLQLYASFAVIGIPPVSMFKELHVPCIRHAIEIVLQAWGADMREDILKSLAIKCGIFPAKTTKKSIKDLQYHVFCSLYVHA